MDLLKRFRAGDREAFTALYRAHHPSVFRFAFHMTGDRDRATEITQEVFVWLIHHPGDYKPERGELGAFLLGVTRKFVLRGREKERRFIGFEDDYDPVAPEQVAEPDVEDLRKAISGLPHRYREAVVLCDLEDRSYEEASEMLGCPIGTVRSRLHRARELLGKKLKARQGCSA